MSLPVTRKPANVRMGKGKGGRVGLRAYINPGRSLLNFSSIRPGVLKSIHLHAQVRCAFRLGIVNTRVCGVRSSDFIGGPAYWVRFKRVQASYVTPRFTEYSEILRRMRRPLLLGYFLRLFWWRCVVPHAQ